MNKNPLFKRVLLGLVSLLSVLAITGCAYTPLTGTVVEMKQTRKLVSIKPYLRKDCNQLVIVDKDYDKHDRCVSDRVFQNAMLGHQITLTEEYH